MKERCKLYADFPGGNIYVVYNIYMYVCVYICNTLDLTDRHELLSCAAINVVEQESRKGSLRIAEGAIPLKKV